MDKRFVNKEFSLLKRLTAFISDLLYMKDDLQSRLELIPNGQKRMDDVLNGISDLIKDVVATGPESQKRQLYNTIKDYKIELTPKLTPGSPNVLMSKEQVKCLIDIAQEKCESCVEDPKAAKNCRLYKFLEITALPSSYDSLLCPYSRATWGD